MFDNKIDELIFQALPFDFQFLVVAGAVSIIYFTVSIGCAAMEKLFDNK